MKTAAVNDIDMIRMQIRTLDDAEARGVNVTAARAYWCQKAVDWATERMKEVPDVVLGCPWCGQQPLVDPEGYRPRRTYCVNHGCVGYGHIMDLDKWNACYRPNDKVEPQRGSDVGSDALLAAIREHVEKIPCHDCRSVPCWYCELKRLVASQARVLPSSECPGSRSEEA